MIKYKVSNQRKSKKLRLVLLLTKQIMPRKNLLILLNQLNDYFELKGFRLAVKNHSER